MKATFIILPPGIASLVFVPASVHGGTTTAGTVTLDGAAPAGGASVALSTEADALSLPSAVLVSSGAATATFNAVTSPVEQDASARVTASFGESAFEALVRITAPQIAGFDVTPATLVGGEMANATATLDAPAATSCAPVALTSSDTATVPAPATITVPSGATTESTALPTEPVAAPVILCEGRHAIFLRVVFRIPTRRVWRPS